MPSIIPALPSPWPSTSPLTSAISVGSGYTVANGTILYFNSAGSGIGFLQSSAPASLINSGEVWIRQSGSAAFRMGEGGDVINNGLVVVESETGYGYGIYDDANTVASGGLLENNGQLFVFGHVFAVGIAGRRSGIGNYRNTGLIAAHSDAGEAVGMQFGSGTDNAINTATGQILVEGVSAIGVDILGRNSFTNQGSITAQTIANPVSGQVENYSIGIAGYASSAGYLDTLTITNSGTITADIAIRGYSIVGYWPRAGTMTVNNLAGGTLNGAVILDFTRDTLNNSGAINGLVAMGDGDDVLNTTSGTINGLVDMGFGDDRFEGSAGADYVLGNKGADILNGAGGADLLLGGAGNDRIVGGLGNDGLYGELGDDLIISQGGDYISGGDGNDRIELGDLQFYAISGGNGIDTLVLPNGTFSLDWHQLVSGGLVTGIEQLVMRGNQEIGLTAADLAGLVGQTLTVNTAGISDRLDLVGAWTEGAGQTIGGVAYRSFTLAGSTVLVGGGGTVAVVATMPGGLGGLDPFIGKAPPLPGAIPGADLTSNVWIARQYELGTDFTIDAGETWMPDPDETFGVLNAVFQIYDNIAFRNDGAILHNTAFGGRVLDIGFVYTVTNNGSLVAHSDGGWIEAISIDQHGTVRNTGTIEVVARDYAYGIVSFGIDRNYDQYGDPIATIPAIYNSGSISVTSNQSFAVAINSGGETILNYGSIQATGGRDTSGIRAGGALATFENTGTLSAALRSGASGQTLGIWVNNLYYDNNRLVTTITNSGTISASVAILVNGQANVLPPPFTYPMANLHLTNTNIINGDITLTDTLDTVVNSGTITGTVSLGAGNDSFDGSLGSMVGLVRGEAGNDTLIGGAQADWFDGGAGNDAIQGGGGIDRAVYADVEGSVTVDLRVTSAQDTGGAGTDTLSGIEELTGSAYADNLIGNGEANRLDGGDGDDTLTGGGGDDRLIGGAGQNDVAVFSGARANYLVEEVQIGGVLHYRVTGQGSAAGDGVDLLSDVEILRFADQDLRIGNYRPVLGAAVMPDQSAGDGALFSYQIPADAFFDANGDALTLTVTLADGSPLPGWLSFNAATRTLSGTPPLASVGIQIDIRVTASDNAPGDPGSTVSDNFSLTIFQSPGADINGTSGVDLLAGTFRAERMFGLDGDDTFSGSSGADLMSGGTGIDTADYSLSAAAVSVDLGGVGSGGDAEGDTWDSIETVRGSLSGHDTLRGSNSAETLLGLGGNDALYGGGGDDILDGGSGANYLFGEAGNDRLLLGSEIENLGSWSVYSGGEGTDTVAVSGAVSIATIEYLNLEAIELVSGAALNLSGYQFNSGFAANSSIIGTGSLTINMSEGYYFFATLMNVASTVALAVQGTVGLDVIKGPLTAAITVNAGDGADQIRTGNLADTIIAGDGNDKIMGLGGADVLTGGAGADQFRYLFTTDSGIGTAADRILDFTNGSDKLDFRVLDADPNTAGRQALTFIGTSAFATDGSAQLRYVDIGADTRVEIDLNGDGAADMHILLSGHAGQALSGTELLL